MSISASQVKELRERTGVGMMECKKALGETAGDLEKAINWLRERGMSRAAAKAGRVTAEGTVEVLIASDQSSGAMLEVNCETDFVSKNDDFQSFVKDLAAMTLKGNCASIEDLTAHKMKDGSPVQERLASLIAKIGENMQLRRLRVFHSNNGVVAGYSHAGGKIGTIVVIDGAKGADVAAIAKDIAMHVAAAAPRYISSADVKPDELEQERTLARKKLLDEKKPPEIAEKILEGQMRKFFEEICLVNQAFVKDPAMTIGKLLESSGKPLKVTAFGRFQLGEGIEKNQTDFAAEVAAQLK